MLARVTRRLRPLDWILVILLMGSWALIFARTLDEGLRTGLGRLRVSLYSAADRNAYPTVRKNNLPGGNVGLEVGDEILAVAGRDMAGASALRVHELATRVALEQGSAPLRVRRAGSILEVQKKLVPTPGWWLYLAVSAAVMLSGLLLFVRTTGWPVARRYFVAMWSFCTAQLLMPNTITPRAVSDGLIVCLLMPLGAALIVLSAQEFTPSARPVPWIHRSLAVLSFLFPFAHLTIVLFLSYPVATLALGVVSIPFFVVSGIAGLARTYRRSEPLERRQIRWIALGGVVAGTAQILNLVAFLLGAPVLLIALLTSISLVAIPLGVLVAVLGYGWLDVDHLISATASYTIVGLAVLGVALALLPGLAHAAAPVLGLDPATGQWALTLGLVGAAIPVHRSLRPRIDRRLFTGRHQRMQGFERLLDEIGRCTSVEALTHLPGERLDALLEPESIAIYAREEAVFTPLFVRGRAAPPAFETDSPLLHTLARRTRPLAVGAAELDAFDRAALETLGVAVVVPTRRGETVVAFTCLGPKRSGDIYTPEEIAYLTAIADRCSEVLVRLDAEVVLREARDLQRSLRRYVPGAVAAELDGGRDLESAEREITILFVDMRGYTSFSERRTANEIFSTLNAYTEKVSGIVRERGGSIVEFHGDGLLAVFGAPRALERKERAAVEAAREVIDALAGQIEVGIGIATGPDYVGNIRAADRLIWTAIGNTTNLAARLQALTREIDAAIAIDAATHAAAGYVCADFVHHAASRIRGRSEPQDVWALELSRAEAPGFRR
jgi:class 3 adenylate cyclase